MALVFGHRWEGRLRQLPEGERQRVLRKGCEGNFFCHLGPPGRGAVGQELLFKGLVRACIDTSAGHASGGFAPTPEPISVYLPGVDSDQWAPLLEGKA